MSSIIKVLRRQRRKQHRDPATGKYIEPKPAPVVRHVIHWVARATHQDFGPACVHEKYWNKSHWQVDIEAPNCPKCLSLKTNENR